jgi:PAS domain S-box-containing protein
MALAAFIPLVFDWLRATIVTPARSWRRLLMSAPAWWVACIGMAIASLTEAFVAGAERPPGQMILEPIYTPYFPAYAVYYILSLGLLLLNFTRSVRTSTGATRTELQFVMLGSATGITVGVMINIILPLMTGNSQFALLTPVSVICLYIVIGYGIATRRIMDVATFIRRLAGYAFLIVFLALAYAVAYLATRNMLHFLALPAELVPQFIASLVVAFSLAPSRGWLQAIGQHLFVNVEPFNAGTAIKSANALFRSVQSMDRLLLEFTSLVRNSIGVSAAVIVIRQPDGYRQWHPETNAPVTFPLDDPLPAALNSAGEPIVPELLRRVRLTPAVDAACGSVERLGFAAAIGLRSPEGLEGVLLLPLRMSGKIYGTPEQEALQLLCNHLAVALSNARLFTQVENGKLYNDILVDSLASGIVATGGDGLISVFNREAQRITGMPPAALLGQPAGALPPPLAGLMEQTLARKEGFRDQETVMPRASGDALPLRVSSAVFAGRSGDIQGGVLIVSDLTAVKQLELQVRRTDRLASLGTLAAGMAHEIKNPLVSIKTFTQLLPERFDDGDFRETFTSLVGGEVKRIDSIVNQLLRFSRPSKPILAPTSLRGIIENALTLLQQQFRQKIIRLETRFTAEPAPINADHNQLGQAFINFFLNAIESMSEGGALTVTTEIPDSRVLAARWGLSATPPRLVVTIRDTGAGIAPQDLPHIFDPFFTTKSQGTGLGLSVAHGIIHEHGGVIHVDSPPGGGTVFEIVLPMLEEAPFS